MDYLLKSWLTIKSPKLYPFEIVNMRLSLFKNFTFTFFQVQNGTLTQFYVTLAHRCAHTSYQASRDSAEKQT